VLLRDGQVLAGHEVPGEELKRLFEVGDRGGVSRVLEQVHRRFKTVVDQAAVGFDPGFLQHLENGGDTDEGRRWASRGRWPR
jgi:hypothetical protein